LWFYIYIIYICQWTCLIVKKNTTEERNGILEDKSEEFKFKRQTGNTEEPVKNTEVYFKKSNVHVLRPTKRSAREWGSGNAEEKLKKQPSQH
jgi:hypothetical protein